MCFNAKEMEYKVITLTTVTIVILVTMGGVQGQDIDYTDPFKCFFCFGPAKNSSCSDPVIQPKTLSVIECETGICLKWTLLYNNTMYMHRTCSDRLEDFQINMMDGVCRTESSGTGYLCMCGNNLCNSVGKFHCGWHGVFVVSIIMILLYSTNDAILFS